MGTFHIHIKGRVQGVGFRPYVYKLAQSQNLNGWVCNASDGVHIRFHAEKAHAEDFYQTCLNRKPELAIISESFFKEVTNEPFDDFRIIESQNAALELSLAPDFAVCEACLEDMHDPENNRYQYPFITCTMCGPRYSILKGLPYDRPETTMDSFHMCASCMEEYLNPQDRRYHSQTNSCPDCGISLTLSSPEEQMNGKSAVIIDRVVSLLQKDQIIAVKGIGGFLLLVNATSAMAVNRLRDRKQRPKKPFAVLYPDLTRVKASFTLLKEEKEALLSPAAPIVLLRALQNIDLPISVIAPNLDRVGVMLPYAPLLDLVAKKFGKPLIATSANISGSPILYETDESGLFHLADYILANNRPITFPQDDSVVQFSPKFKDQILLRRSRGYAPGTFSADNLQGQSLALGAEMKGAFALTTHANAYVSPYLGDLTQYENQVQYEHVLREFMALVHARPERIIVDAHPGFFSHQLGLTLADELDIPVHLVQHHEAHFASVLAEGDLLEEENVLGVVWDGTGFGSDGHIWGGEFFDLSDGMINRIAHLEYFAQLANDRMAKDNKLCALSVTGAHLRSYLRSYFDQTSLEYYLKVLEQPTLFTSSMGRMFDAVAFLAGVSETNAYEGQAGMLLEDAARKTFERAETITPYSFHMQGSHICLQPAIDEIIEDRMQGSDQIAARFHLTLVHIIREIAISGNYRNIACSGGVFQNSLLVDLLHEHLGSSHALFFHKELSPNDENIAYGQLAYLHIQENRPKFNPKEIAQCV